jgi:hypothetical protein
MEPENLTETQEHGEPGPGQYVATIKSLLADDRIGAARAVAATAAVRYPADTTLLRYAEVLAPPVARKTDVRDPDGRVEYAWLQQNRGKYRGLWVAVSGEELVGSAGTLKELMAIIERFQLPQRPLVHRVE